MNEAGRPAVLMPVYNGIEYDGRVRRTAEALSEICDVTVVSLQTGNVFRPTGYRVETISVSPSGSKLRPHVEFWLALLAAARRLRPDAIHAHDFFLAAPGWIASRIAGARFVYDAHELIIPSPGVLMSARDNFWYRLEAWAVRRADIVVAANAERATLMKAHYNLRATPTVVRNIPPIPRGRDCEGATAAALRDPSSSTVRLIYQGDVSLERGIGKFVEAVAQLGPGYELTIVGPGPDTAAVRDLIARLAVSNRVRLRGRVPAAELPAIMRDADIGVISYPQEGLNNIYCAPNKLYEYAQAGIPMVANSNPVLDKVFSQYDIGICGADLTAVIAAAAARQPSLAANIPRFLAENVWEAEAETLREAYSQLFANAARRTEQRG